jgi:hypothetical protein
MRVTIKNFVLAILALLTAGSSFGCQLMSDWFGSEPPHAVGTWTGPLRVLELEDTDGRSHPVAALEVVTGPKVMRPSAGVGGSREIQAGGLVYLTRDRSEAVVPQDLAIGLGQTIRVKGKMGSDPPQIRRDDQFMSLHVEPGKPSGVATIRVRGAVKEVQ